MIHTCPKHAIAPRQTHSRLSVSELKHADELCCPCTWCLRSVSWVRCPLTRWEASIDRSRAASTKHFDASVARYCLLKAAFPSQIAISGASVDTRLFKTFSAPQSQGPFVPPPVHYRLPATETPPTKRAGPQSGWIVPPGSTLLNLTTLQLFHPSAPSNRSTTKHYASKHHTCFGCIIIIIIHTLLLAFL